jgi:hypothetical protein
MTDEQQKALIKELMAIREGMATKKDLLSLEEGLTAIIIRLAETKSGPDVDLKRWMALKDSEIIRLQERADRLSNWYQKHSQLLELFHQRLDRLDAREIDLRIASDLSENMTWMDMPCGECGVTLRGHFLEEGKHTWVPTRTTEPPAQTSIKTNKEKK